jgi:hypothetical protein
MPSLDEMRAELRELKRKAGSAISKLKKSDVERQIELYRGFVSEEKPAKKTGRKVPREMVQETVRHGNVEIKVPKLAESKKEMAKPRATTTATATAVGGAGAPAKRKKIVEVEVTDSESEEEIVVKRKPAKKVVYVESDDEEEED